ncbi:unnamed protein product [Gordionus sp. m RMFG-2023]
MEFKCIAINAQTLSDKFNEKRGEDSGISDHTSISSSNISLESDSLTANDTINDNKGLVYAEDNIQPPIKPKKSRFSIHRVVEKLINPPTPTVENCLNLSIKFEIRNPYPSEISEICNWRHEEFGYRAHQDYLMSLYNCYPSGWIVAVGEKGKIIGTIFGMNMNEHQAFGGLFAVKKPYRCKGIGGKLWKIRVNYIGNRNLGVNAVESRIVPNEKLGMKLAFRMSRFYGRITARIMNSFRVKLSLQDNSNYTYTKMSYDEVELQKGLLHSLIEYDTQINTISREQFIEESINHFEHTVTIVCTEDLHNDKKQNIEMSRKVVGYGMLRPRFEGNTIGPLYADSPKIAESIFRHLLSHITEPNTLLDITIIDDCFGKKYSPKTMIGSQHKSIHSRSVKNMIANLGLDLECHLYRMYSKDNIILPVDKVFAMTSSEAFLL